MMFHVVKVGRFSKPLPAFWYEKWIKLTDPVHVMQSDWNIYPVFY